ncbi:hypothetical protein PMZ80_004004 [Knufia obscura]|uniref:Glycoside hydrolase family 71 protein n=2 Tax=Knufia TaxID=430999 RepID=A0AAN8ECG8_9EURO|nr:hypothetical protein PMZ80_004004 [Knufia obscura]KAK5952269.1 hypothetical protein OHC33_006742 [Knufia fluminis]
MNSNYHFLLLLTFVLVAVQVAAAPHYGNPHFRPPFEADAQRPDWPDWTDWTGAAESDSIDNVHTVSIPTTAVPSVPISTVTITETSIVSAPVASTPIASTPITSTLLSSPSVSTTTMSNATSAAASTPGGVISGPGSTSTAGVAQTDSSSTGNNTTTGRLVFAHFMMGIVSNRKAASDYDLDMQLAKSHGIDAFALNIGTDSYNDQQLDYAYTSAENNGMKVFISFDFNWWSTDQVGEIAQKVSQYATRPSQLMLNGKAFVSTFSGDGLDVAALKGGTQIPIHFVPNFSPAKGTSLVEADGVFNWMAWPNNGNNRAPDPGQNFNETINADDQQCLKALSNTTNKDYMAPISPWFFTHYGTNVSYAKNWMFPSDTLWYDRWNQILEMGPKLVEIITWNDYGESHYVGPLNTTYTDDGASLWTDDMPHDGWLTMAKPYIAAYKDGAKSVDGYIKADQLVYWYRPQPSSVDCDATDNTMTGAPSGNFYNGRPNGWEQVADDVFVVALLTSPGTVTISSGDNSKSFDVPAGATLLRVAMGIGSQKFSLGRGGQSVLSGTSAKDILNSCQKGIYNFNAYVGTVG